MKREDCSLIARRLRRSRSPILATEKRKRIGRTKDRIYLVWHTPQEFLRDTSKEGKGKKEKEEKKGPPASAGASSVHYFREMRAIDDRRRSSMIHGVAARKLLYFPTWKRRIIIRGRIYSLATLIAKGEKRIARGMIYKWIDDPHDEAVYKLEQGMRGGKGGRGGRGRDRR